MSEFRIIDNIHETMGTVLPPMIREANKSLYCGIGYFLNSGYKNIQDEIIDIANKGSDVKIIAGNIFIQVDGVSQINPNLDKETYELIININDRCNGKIQLRSIKEQFFHGKFFLGISSNKASFIGGSSNMSFRAISTKGNIEYNLYTEQDIDSELIKQNKDWFLELWNTKAVALTPDNIEEIRFLLNKLIFGIDVQEDIREKGKSTNKSTIEIACEIINNMLKNIGVNTSDTLMSKVNPNQPDDIFVYMIWSLYQHKNDLKTNKISEIIKPLCFKLKKSEDKVIKEINSILEKTSFRDYYYDVLAYILKQKANKGFIPDYATFLTDMVNLFDIYYNQYHNKAYKKGRYSSENGKTRNPHMNTKNVDGTGRTFYKPINVSDNRAEYLLEAIRNIRGSFDDSWLFQYQTFDVNILVKKYNFLEKGAYIAHEAGMGKSPIMCKFIKEVQSQNRDTRILIVVPASLITQWQEENLEKDFGISSEIVDNNKLKIEGDSIWTNRRINICSIDFIKHFIEKETNEDFIKAMSPDILVIDESHLLKNSKSGRYAEISKLSPKFVLMASATPLQNQIKEFLAQLKLIDSDVDIDKCSDKAYVNKLKDKYVIRRTRKHDLAEIKGISQAIRNVKAMEISLNNSFKSIYDELEQRLKKGELYYYSFLGELKDNKERYKNIDSMASFMTLQELTSSTMACIQGLTKIKEKIEFILNSKFRELSEENINDYDTTEEREILSMLYDNQGKINSKMIEKLKKDLLFIDEFINKNTGKLYKNGMPIKNPKEDFFLEMTYEVIGKKQAIVFVKYIDTGVTLKDELTKKGITTGFFEGSLSRKQRKELIEQFKDGTIQILLCTDAANAGLNLQTTNILINYDLNWNPQIVEQRIGRVHRIGQKSAEVDIFNLILKDTVDGRIQELMKKKEETFNNIFATSDTILGQIAREYMKGDLDKITFCDVPTINTEDEILTENIEETTKLNNDYYYMEAVLRQLLMWVMGKHGMSYATDDNETYYVKLSGSEEVQLIHLNQVYNMIEDENDFFKDFNSNPITNRTIKKYEKNIEGFYFGKEHQLARHMEKELVNINASDNIRENIKNLILKCKNKNLLLLNLNVDYIIEHNEKDFRRNEFQTVAITPEFDLYSDTDVVRLFYIVPSDPIGSERIDVVKNGSNYITMYNKILKYRLIADKQNSITNNEIKIKDVEFEIYNGTIIEIN